MPLESIISLVIAVLGFLAAFFQWRGKAKAATAADNLKKALEGVIAGVETADIKEVKQIIDTEAGARGIKDFLDKILVDKGYKEE